MYEEIYTQLEKLNKELEKQNKEELLKLIANRKAELDVKKMEFEIEYFVKSYEKLLKDKALSKE